VHVHEPFADGCEDVQRRRRAVDELAVCAARYKSALEDELIVFARFEAVFLEKRFQRRTEFGDIEGGFDGAAFFAAADERAVGAFAEDEIERADDDGFARAGLAGDDIATGLEFQREVWNKSEVFDAERRQHAKNFNAKTPSRKAAKKNPLKKLKCLAPLRLISEIIFIRRISRFC